MTGTPNIAVYEAGALAPDKIYQNLDAARSAGWTTIILGLLHIGRQEIQGQQYGDIVYGDGQIVVQDGAWMLPDLSWPDAIARLKQDGPITQIYASFGGGGVEDYKSLQHIYVTNGNSFAGTPLERNFQLFKENCPAIDGIDLDCEETYDPASFVAFCEMLAGMGFGLTFCPYSTGEFSFWTGALAALNASAPGSVKWWNLQCYDGGVGNDPGQWAAAIRDAIPGFTTDGFILAGDWNDDTPAQVEYLFSGFAAEPSVGGGFIWDMNSILTAGGSMADYVAAIRAGLSPPPRRAAPRVPVSRSILSRLRRRFPWLFRPR